MYASISANADGPRDAASVQSAITLYTELTKISSSKIDLQRSLAIMPFNIPYVISY